VLVHPWHRVAARSGNGDYQTLNLPPPKRRIGMSMIIGLTLFSIVPALLAGWIICFLIDPEAFRSGAKR